MGKQTPLGVPFSLLLCDANYFNMLYKYKFHFMIYVFYKNNVLVN